MFNNSFIPKSVNTENKTWPADKFAAIRRPNATGLHRLLTNSMKTKRGLNNNGAPPGKKLLK